MSGKIKIAMVTNHFDITGISTVILNYCKGLDHSKFNLTVIAGIPISDQNRADCEEYGIELIELPSRHQRTFSHYYQLWRTLKKNKYDIVHIHGSSSMMAIELIIAKLAGIKKRIAHSHNSFCPNPKLNKILNPIFKRAYTKGLACSTLAGDWIFGKGNYLVLPNAFYTERFKFSSDLRRKMRENLHLNNKFVIGHVGRFNYQKNHEYLLKVFQRVVRNCPNTVLLLVGIGPDFDKIKDYVQTLDYAQNIVFYGDTSSPEELYNAMDLFAFPSRYEGLGIVMLEAQISGLPCLASSNIPKEVKICDNVTFLDISDDDIDFWSDCIMKYMKESVDRNHAWDRSQEIIQRYDINKTCDILSDLYLNML